MVAYWTEVHRRDVEKLICERMELRAELDRVKAEVPCPVCGGIPGESGYLAQAYCKTCQGSGNKYGRE
jgi:DnaJ-class molecular chaperone